MRFSFPHPPSEFKSNIMQFHGSVLLHYLRQSHQRNNVLQLVRVEKAVSRPEQVVSIGQPSERNSRQRQICEGHLSCGNITSMWLTMTRAVTCLMMKDSLWSRLTSENHEINHPPWLVFKRTVL